MPLKVTEYLVFNFLQSILTARPDARSCEVGKTLAALHIQWNYKPPYFTQNITILQLTEFWYMDEEFMEPYLNAFLRLYGLHSMKYKDKFTFVFITMTTKCSELLYEKLCSIYNDIWTTVTASYTFGVMASSRRTLTQAVSRRVRARVKSCGICGGWSGTGQVFS
jgi:hypothetical protein